MGQSSIVSISVLGLGPLLAMGLIIGQEAASAQEPVDKNAYFTKWTHYSAAEEKAKQYRTGILWFFPVKGSDDEHPMFKRQAMAELSARVTVVKVGEKCVDRGTYRVRYEVPEKYMTFVLTDYYGNLIDKVVAKRGAKEKIKVAKKFSPVLKDCQTRWIVPQRTRIKKILDKADKNLKGKRWSKAAAGYQEITALRGFKDVEKAETRLAEIVDRGQGEIKRANRLDHDEAIKKLKRIAKDYKGCEVEEDARAAIEVLELDG